jgi:hypothetical protein
MLSQCCRAELTFTQIVIGTDNAEHVLGICAECEQMCLTVEDAPS